MAKKQSAKQSSANKRTQSSASAAESTKRGARKKADKTDLSLPLNKTNYGLIALGFLLVIIGFILMSGSDNIYSFRKLTLSVIAIIGGYVVIGYGIIKRSDVGESHKQEEKHSVS